LNITSAKPFAIKALTLRFAGSVQKYLMSATLPQFLESNRPTNAARLPMQFVAAHPAHWRESARFTSNLRLTAENQRDSLPKGCLNGGEMLTDTLAAHINDAAGKHERAWKCNRQ
jgi:hypothetical protein